MKIRDARPEDTEYIQEAAERTWKETYIEILDEETIQRIIDDWYRSESLKRQIREHDHFYVIEEKGELAGFINATVENDVAELHRLYIYPDYWRQGFGTELYRELEDELSSEVEKIRLTVIPENDPAAEFYRENGFEKVEEKDTELKGEEVTQEIMEKEI
jgi:ribosomal protein S18 acetylase RimI-like enzyme